MRFHTFLLKYGEIGIKGKNRHLFEDALVRQVRYALKDVDGQFDVHKSQARIYVDCEGDYDYDETVEHLKKVFGLVGICPVVRMEDKGFEELKKDVVAYMDEMYPDKNFTFKVESRRAKKSYPLNSMEISRDLGEAILYAFPESGIKVDVHHPDVMVNVEVRNEIYVYSQIIPGAGGMPVGTNGSAMLLLSGGIDSPVAGYRMSRRGVHISAIHYVSPPYTSDRAQEKVEQLCQKLTAYCGSIAFFCVPFTEIQEEIKKNCPEPYFTIIMRRLMVEIAQKIAAKDDCSALITGESLAQVASQTMQAIACTDAAQNLPILRPLIGMDKTEIIAISRKIGTFDTSIEPYEDCCTIFTPPHPKTKPSLAEIEAAEAGMPGLAELERIAAETVEKIPIRIGDDPEF